jgi:hypothetical protein
VDSWQSDLDAAGANLARIKSLMVSWLMCVAITLTDPVCVGGGGARSACSDAL